MNEAIQIISQYNGRLAAEMEERGKLAIMMRDFQNEQKELLSQAEERLDVIIFFIIYIINKLIIHGKINMSVVKVLFILLYN